MALIDRLTGAAEPKIPVHQFWAGMVELSHGEITVAQFKTYFNLTGDDATDFNWLVAKYQASANKAEFVELMHAIFMLSEMDTPGYTSESDITARINRIG